MKVCTPLFSTYYARYLVNAADSVQFKEKFPLFWDVRRNLDAQEPAQHNEMANKYVDKIMTFVKHYNPGIEDNMARSLAWKGLVGTKAWNNRSDTN